MSELKILNLHVKDEYNDLIDVVMEVSWSLSQKLPYQGPNGEDMYVSVFGNSELSDPDPNTFTDYENLTKEMVKNWIIGTKEYYLKEQELGKQYRSQTIVNIVVKDPPWTK